MEDERPGSTRTIPAQTLTLVDDLGTAIQISTNYWISYDFNAATHRIWANYNNYVQAVYRGQMRAGLDSANLQCVGNGRRYRRPGREMAPADQARAAITSCHGCSFSQSRPPEGGGITIITRNIKLKKLLLFSALLCVLCGSVFAQNLTTVSASNITDINGSKLAAGQLCFLITDQSDNPISVSIGGGGQALKRGYCGAVAAGVVTPTFTVPNPSATSPSGIYYRVTVKDSSTGQEVLRYSLVSFTGATFNFDNYAPTNLAQGAPLSGTVVSGNLSGNGNATFTGTVTGSNIPSSILQQIFSSGVGQTQRTAFNMIAGLTCSDNAGTSRTDCRLGTLTTVTFSATPTFDASTTSTFKLTLTGNVTSSTLSNAVAGEPINIEICQHGVGSRTFVCDDECFEYGNHRKRGWNVQHSGILVRRIKRNFFRADAEQWRINYSRHALRNRNFDSGECESERSEHAGRCD